MSGGLDHGLPRADKTNESTFPVTPEVSLQGLCFLRSTPEPLIWRQRRDQVYVTLLVFVHWT